MSSSLAAPRGLKTGTFQISGDQADYGLCAACVNIYANDSDGFSPEMVYMAQSGTLVVTSMEGNFAGSFTPTGNSATFVGYREDEIGFETLDACTATGGRVSWDKAVD